MKKLYFIILSAIIFIAKTYAGSLNGTSSAVYQPYHNVFYDTQSAVGLVRMANGFSVVTRSAGAGSTHGASVYLDTSISVSGYIDLKDTNTMILLSDLRLDNGASFSSSGKIYGKDRTIFLGGDLNIPNNIVLHFAGRVAIDGGGNSINLGDNSQLFVDTGATLTLRNLTLSNSKNFVGNPAIKLASSGSQLALDNSILDMTGDFYFNCGSMFIHNDVLITGTNSFIYRSSSPSFITSGATLAFNPDTAFDFRPATTGTTQLLAKDLIFMRDSTSQLYLNGCTLKSTLTGLRLTKGSVIFDNKVSITSQAAPKLSENPQYTSFNLADTIGSTVFSPDGRFLAITTTNNANAITVYRFYGTSLTILPGCTKSTSVNQGGVAWSPDGKYLASVGSNGGASLRVFIFDGTNLTELSGTDLNPGSGLSSVQWSPDGRYLALTYVSGIVVYSFNGVSLAPVASNSATRMLFCVWSPDGKYIATSLDTLSGSYSVRVYRFSTSGLTELTGCRTLYTSWTYILAWSPDGKFLAKAGDDTNYKGIQVLSFNGNSLAALPQCTLPYRSTVRVCWSSNGRYLAASISSSEGTNTLRIYRFENNSLIELPKYRNATGFPQWSPDDNYWLSILDKNLYVYKNIFTSETAQQALSNSIVFGNSSLDSNYDVNLRLLSSANVEVDGLVNYDNVS